MLHVRRLRILLGHTSFALPAPPAYSSKGTEVQDALLVATGLPSPAARWREGGQHRCYGAPLTLCAARQTYRSYDLLCGANLLATGPATGVAVHFIRQYGTHCVLCRTLTPCCAGAYRSRTTWSTTPSTHTQARYSTGQAAGTSPLASSRCVSSRKPFRGGQDAASLRFALTCEGL